MTFFLVRFLDLVENLQERSPKFVRKNLNFYLKNLQLFSSKSLKYKIVNLQEKNVNFRDLI